MDINIFLTLIVIIFPKLAEARYCTSFEVDGESKYYICPRNEYCCNFGCCLTPTFQFYQLWYYWLMVIFMFLLCSGGTWWYRYWLQGGYPRDLPPARRLNQSQPHTHSAQVCYYPAHESVVMHHVWKLNRNGSVNYFSPPPSYTVAQSCSTDQATPTHSRRDSSQSPKQRSSAYYQLYGPPPSYESVITETVNEQARNQPIPTVHVSQGRQE